MSYSFHFLRLGICVILLGLPASTVHAQSAEEDARVVSLGGSITEIVYALGAGARLVGVDASSLYPAKAQELPDVGYFRQVPAEGVLSLAPTLILASDDTGPPVVLEQLRSADVEVVVVPEAPSVEGAKAKIRAVAEALGMEEKGEVLIRQMDKELAEALALREKADAMPRVLFVLARGSGTLMAAGTNTSAAQMIELAGGENAVTAFSGYKPMTSEAVVRAAPDVILMMTRGLKSLGGAEGLFEQPGIALTPAGKNHRLVTIDGLLLLGFGPRLGEAVTKLMTTLHPELQRATP